MKNRDLMSSFQLRVGLVRGGRSPGHGGGDSRIWDGDCMGPTEIKIKSPNCFKELMFLLCFSSPRCQQATFQTKLCPLREHFPGFRGLSAMPITRVSVTRLLVRRPGLLETLTNPCKYRIRFSFPNPSVHSFPPLRSLWRILNGWI